MAAARHIVSLLGLALTIAGICLISPLIGLLALAVCGSIFGLAIVRGRDRRRSAGTAPAFSPEEARARYRSMRFFFCSLPSLSCSCSSPGCSTWIERLRSCFSSAGCALSFAGSLPSQLELLRTLRALAEGSSPSG